MLLQFTWKGLSTKNIGGADVHNEKISEGKNRSHQIMLRDVVGQCHLRVLLIYQVGQYEKRPSQSLEYR